MMSHAGVSLKSVDHEYFERVWAVVTEMGLEERHFNSLQADYRKLASTWLLAAFAAMGFTISTAELALPINRLLLVCAIGVAAAIGLALLWIIDILVYHRLLLACFEEGQALEDEHRFLPRVRNHMAYKTQHGARVAPSVVLFYAVAIGVSLTISGGAFWLWLLAQSTVLAALGAGAWVLIIGGAVEAMRLLSDRVETPSNPFN